MIDIFGIRTPYRGGVVVCMVGKLICRNQIHWSIFPNGLNIKRNLFAKVLLMKIIWGPKREGIEKRVVDIPLGELSVSSSKIESK